MRRIRRRAVFGAVAPRFGDPFTILKTTLAIAVSLLMAVAYLPQIAAAWTNPTGSSITLTTTPSPGGTVGTAVLNDTAQVSGGHSPGGSIVFHLYDPGHVNCSGTPTYVQTVTVTGDGSYSTTNATPANRSGSWSWTASYSGDANNHGASSGCGQETVTVAKGSPTLATTPTPGGTVGAVVLNDTGRVSGGYVPGGSVVFHLYDPGHENCSGTPTYVQTVPVTGDGSYSTTYTTPANRSGTWSWTVSYSGDANNNGATSGCGQETVTVAKGSPSLATTPTPGGAAGTVVLNDTAQVSGGFAPGGSIVFHLYDPGHKNCSGTPTYAQTVPVSGNGSYSTTNTTPASRSGNWSWTVSYSGDANNNGATSGCGQETVTVGSAALTLFTNPTAGGVVGAVVLNDTAQVSGGDTPSGSITFNLYDPAHTDCSGTPAYTQTVTVAGDGSYSTTNTTPANLSGTWSWTASYSGDANNNGATSGCTQETVAVSKAAPSLITTPSLGGTVGAVVLNDTGTLSGGSQPSGSVTFNLYDPAHTDCSGAPTYTQTVPVSGNGSFSTTNATAADATGTWSWTASYTGDANNNGATSGCTQETVTVTKASPSLTTTPSPGGTVGAVVLNDTGSVSGGYSPGGSITFSLYDPAHTDCSGAPTYTQTVPVSGNGSFSTTNATAADATGTWSLDRLLHR